MWCPVAMHIDDDRALRGLETRQVSGWRGSIQIGRSGIQQSRGLNGQRHENDGTPTEDHHRDPENTEKRLDMSAHVLLRSQWCQVPLFPPAGNFFTRPTPRQSLELNP